ncbi:hypothetical protein [Paenibacillus sp. FSL F4-0097]|uniref:hypothetical protein n=1 Tax=Paenibacillus sp. FSL F4-0097 TaxID=2921369 RepID=UPI003158A27B
MNLQYGKIKHDKLEYQDLLDQLEACLTAAVLTNEYRYEARLRDQIKRLERNRLSD